MRSFLCAIVTAALVGMGLAPAAQAADAPAPRRVTVTVSTSGVKAPESLPAGRYRLQVNVPGRVDGLLVLVKPDAGYTRADLRADDSRGPAGDRRIRQNLRFFGGAQVRPGGTGVLWETLYAGRYWLVGINADRPGRVMIKTVRVHGSPFASRFPHVTAEATSTDRGLRISRVVPRSGRMLIRNQSRHLDALFFLPLKRGADYGDFLRWMRHPRRAPSPLRFRGFVQTLPLSRDAGYVLRYRLHGGEYVAMGLEGFAALLTGRVREARGVIRPVTVRRGGQRTSGASAAASVQGFSAASGGGSASQPAWPAWPAWVLR